MGETGVAGCTYIVQIDVDSAKVVENKVANGIGALDGVRVGVKRLEEPRVSGHVSQDCMRRWDNRHLLGGDELARLLVGP
jgi:hypothetical protein